MNMTLQVRLQLAAAAVLALLLMPVVQAATPKANAEMPITTSSREAKALFQQARDKVDNLENEAAAPLLDQAIQKDPGFAMAYAYRAFTGGGFNVLRENLDKAASLADKVSAGERLWIMARQAQADGKPARAPIDELLKLHPTDKRVAQLAGSDRGTFADGLPAALEHYRKAVALDTQFASAYNQIGYTHSRLGDYVAAENAFKSYIALRSGSPNPYDSYAELLMRMGRFDDSIAQYQKALEKDPGFTSALAGIGHNHQFKGDSARARESYQRQFDQAANLSGKTSALSWTTASYVHEGKLAEALQALERQRAFAVKEKLIPNAIGTHEQAASILGESGDLAGSAGQVELASRMLEASALPVATKDAIRLRLMLARARTLIAVHEFEAAGALIERCRTAVESSGSPGETHALESVLARWELEQGRHDKALAHFANADPENSYDIFYTALTLERKGDNAEAARLYSKVAAWNQNDLGYALVRARALARP
jgi:tetratricopeptide (TPR) repeat protein